MTRIEKQVFLNVKSVGSFRTFEDLDLVRCDFTGSNLSQFDDPQLNLIVRNVNITRCTGRRSSLAGVRLEDVAVDRFTSSATFLEACTFRHVTLRGPVGNVMFLPPNPGLPTEMRDAFTASIVRYYEEVDWAIDISQAEFTSVNFYFVPGHLVRRDEETQYLLRRERFVGVDLGPFPLRAQIAVQRFESTPFDSIVAIAPKRAKDFLDVKAALDELRKAGLAD